MLSFRLGPFPVRVQPAFFLIVALLGAGRLEQPGLLAVWVGVVFVSILLHELGHAVAFRAFGHAPSIELYGMGGVTRGGGGGALGTGANVLVALAGPAAGLTLGAAVYALARSVGLEHPLARVAVYDLLWVNVGWGLLNLLPMRPLDGGIVMTALARRVWGHPRGEAVADVVTLVVAAACAIAAIAFEMPWAALLAAFFGSESFIRIRQRRRAHREGGSFSTRGDA